VSCRSGGAGCCLHHALSMADGCLQLLEQERRMPMHLCFKHARTCVKVSEVSPGCQHNHGVGLFHTMSPMPQNVTQWQATRFFMHAITAGYL